MRQVITICNTFSHAILQDFYLARGENQFNCTAVANDAASLCPLFIVGEKYTREKFSQCQHPGEVKLKEKVHAI